jgi:hypothetical protein
MRLRRLCGDGDIRAVSSCAQRYGKADTPAATGYEDLACQALASKSLRAGHGATFPCAFQRFIEVRAFCQYLLRLLPGRNPGQRLCMNEPSAGGPMVSERERPVAAPCNKSL